MKTVILIFILLLNCFLIGSAYSQCSGSQVDGGRYPVCTRKQWEYVPSPGFPGSGRPSHLDEIIVYGRPTQPSRTWIPFNLQDYLGGPNRSPNPLGLKNDAIVIKTPCLGDILKPMKLTPSGGWNYLGGTYGNTRSNGTQFHDGIDITAEPGANVFLSHTGTVTSIVKNFDQYYVPRSYGNHVEITFTDSNGDQYKLMYGHLQEVSNDIILGKEYPAGTMFGKSGISGNAGLKPGASSSEVIPHVHIRARKNNEKTDPAELLRTKFNKNTGAVLNPCTK